MALVAENFSLGLKPTSLNIKKEKGLPIMPNPPTSSPKHKLNPNTTQIVLITPSEIKL
jgi:hypothetical protein